MLKIMLNRWPSGMLGLPKKITAPVFRRPRIGWLEGRSDDRALIDREFRRAGRHGRPFTVLEFRLARVSRGGAELVRLESLIRSRVRETDSVGWLGPGEIMVLARYTDARDAMALAEEFYKQAEKAGMALSCTLHPFPPRFERPSQDEATREGSDLDEIDA